MKDRRKEVRGIEGTYQLQSWGYGRRRSVCIWNWEGGFLVWQDYKSLRAGDHYTFEKYEQIAKLDIFVTFVSASSVVSKWVKEETEYAIKESINKESPRIAGLMLDNTEVPFYLSHRHLLDGSKSLEDAISRFIQDFSTDEILLEFYESKALHYCERVCHKDVKKDVCKDIKEAYKILADSSIQMHPAKCFI